MKKLHLHLLLIVLLFFVLLFCFQCSNHEVDKFTIDLSGKWKFRIDPNNVGIQEKWFENNFSETVLLPGSMTENEKGNDISIDTKWTGSIIDKSWFTDEKYEKYRQTDNVKVPFWLQPKKHYVGPAWYQKEILVPKTWQYKQVVLHFERCHWETQLWIDGEKIGSQNSLSTPHKYFLHNLSAGKHVISLRVDNTVKLDIGINAHSVSDHTQTNWNGIIGDISLRALDQVFIDDLQVFPDIQNKAVKVKISIINESESEVNGALEVQASSFNSKKEQTRLAKRVKFSCSDSKKIVEVNYPMGENVLF